MAWHDFEPAFPDGYGFASHDRTLCCYSRKQPVPNTPEERVRQRLLLFLEEQLNLPSSPDGGASPLLSVEEAVGHLGAKGNRARKRIDVVVWDRHRRLAGARPAMLIECKKGRGRLPDTTWEQVARYNRDCFAPHIVIANEEVLEYRSLGGDPGAAVHSARIGAVLADRYSVPQPWECMPLLGGNARRSNVDYRLPEIYLRSESDNKGALEDYLADLILDTRAENRLDGPAAHQLGVRDLGIRWLEPNNPFGAWPGEYRSFLFDDPPPVPNTRVREVSIALMYDGRDELPRLVLNADFVQKGGSLNNKNSLQLDIGRFVREDPNGFYLWHDGRMQGARRPTAGLLASIQASPVGSILIADGAEYGRPGTSVINLGRLPRGPLWFSDPAVQDFLRRSIAYAALRRDHLLE